LCRKTGATSNGGGAGGFAGADGVHLRDGGHAGGEVEPAAFAHLGAGEEAAAVGVLVLAEDFEDEAGLDEGRDDIGGAMGKFGTAVRVLEAGHAFFEAPGDEPLAGGGDVIADAVAVDRFGVAVGPGEPEFVVVHADDGLEFDEDEGAAGREDAGDAAAPGGEVGEPADGAVGREGEVELLACGCGGFEPVVDIGADEVGRDAGGAGEFGREGDGFVGDIDTGDAGAEPGEGEGILAGVALEVDEPLPFEGAEEFQLLREEGGAAFAEEAGLVAFVAVVGAGGFVPGEAVELVEVAARSGHGSVVPRRAGSGAAGAGTTGGRRAGGALRRAGGRARERSRRGRPFSSGRSARRRRPGRGA